MSLEITQEFSTTLYWISLVAVMVSSASGVLKSGFRRFDLFGVIIIAITTGLGGGSLRDMLLDLDVFWIKDQIFFIVSLVSALIIFIGARLILISPKFFLIPDAAGLAAFSIAGTMVALTAGTPWLVSSFMGVITGAMGGIFRDLLCNETPIVFKSPLYATAAWLGSLGFIVLVHYQASIAISAMAAGVFIFITRLIAIRLDLGLPKFQLKE
ncbi:MAG: trimeric intracellular cation channel family protein [Gammaproteobacteria bacterium]|nr:MAG: trimeric intracellular cation channel family protein [Gammaproteobacteria bacterium]